MVRNYAILRNNSQYSIILRNIVHYYKMVYNIAVNSKILAFFGKHIQKGIKHLNITVSIQIYIVDIYLQSIIIVNLIGSTGCGRAQRGACRGHLARVGGC